LIAAQQLMLRSTSKSDLGQAEQLATPMRPATRLG
jgi:hypothetical protein